MAATIVNVQDPVSLYSIAVDSSGHIGINNFPAVQTVQGTVQVAYFPAVQTVAGSVDVTDRSLRQLGIVTIASGGVGTNTAPGYTIVQDGSNNANKLKINADGSINVTGSASSNASVAATGGAVPGSATYLGANKSGTITGLALDASGNLNVNVQASNNTQAVTGTVSVNPLPASTNVIGHVIVDSAANVAVTSLPALASGTNMIGHVIVDSAASVAIASLPSLSSGSNTIGAVTQASGPWTQNLTQVNGAALSNSNPLPVSPQTTSTATLSSIAGSATSVSLLAANPNRKAAYFYNDSVANLYLAFGSTAATNAYTIKLAPGSYYEIPTIPIWQGAVSGIWDSAAGNARITEVS